MVLRTCFGYVPDSRHFYEVILFNNTNNPLLRGNFCDRKRGSLVANLLFLLCVHFSNFLCQEFSSYDLHQPRLIASDL